MPVFLLCVGERRLPLGRLSMNVKTCSQPSRHSDNLYGEVTMRDPSNHLRVSLMLVLMLAVGIAGGVWLDRATLPVRAAPGSPVAGPNLQLITEVWDLIQKNYVDHAAAEPQKL